MISFISHKNIINYSKHPENMSTIRVCNITYIARIIIFLVLFTYIFYVLVYFICISYYQLSYISYIFLEILGYLNNFLFIRISYIYVLYIYKSSNNYKFQVFQIITVNTKKKDFIFNYIYKSLNLFRPRWSKQYYLHLSILQHDFIQLIYLCKKLSHQNLLNSIGGKD